MLNRLRQLRDEAGISQKALAEIIGVSQQSINKYENHNIEPDIQTMIRLADYFRTSVDYLIGHTDIYRPIEATRGYELNERESHMLDGYRALSTRRQRCVDAMIESYNDQL